MLAGHKLVVDEWAEVFDLLRPYADQTFWQWTDVDFDPNKFYIVGRVVLKDNWEAIVELANRYPGRIIFCNPAEGSQTAILQLKRLRITESVRTGRLGFVTSGDLEGGFNQMETDCYFTNIVEYTENLEAAQWQSAVYAQEFKPWSFLFLNGRLRPHRKALIDSLRSRSLLEQALWTNLQDHVDMPWTSSLVTDSNEPIKLLPACYEIDRAQPYLQQPDQQGFVKHQLFADSWGDAIVNPRAYVDSYFSVVTETIFDYPYSFRTEKIWKPIIMCHPFVVAANAGYYRDLHDLGFQTFAHLIDEDFDSIDNSEDRIQRISQVVADICQQGPAAFLRAAEHVCKYNYQHLREYNRSERHDLPFRLARYLDAQPSVTQEPSIAQSF
jgi:hypothetical protein